MLYQKIESSQVSIGRQMYTLYMYNGIFFNLKKECSSNTYYNIDESWIHNAKWKPNMEEQILFASIYVSFP